MEYQPNTKSFVMAVEELINHMQYLSAMGCKGFDCKKKSIDILDSWGSKKNFTDKTLEDIQADLGNCKRCGLFKNRTNIVFGAGNPKARLIFVGEAPGFDEDQTGKPFVGAAGRLFSKIIESVKLTREDIYICNIIKCRPEGNRAPKPDEIKACFTFLKQQIKVIKPDFICALGNCAARTILNTQKPISQLRGNFYKYMGINVMPTYHPAYLLRNTDKKRDVWEDMKKLIKEYRK